MNDSRIYYPRYDLRTDLSADDAAWLHQQQGDGPLALADVTDVCAFSRVSATLYDEAGFVRGWVHADGNYRLQ